MKPEERSKWISEQDRKVVFANEIKALGENQAVQKILEGMIEHKIRMVKALADFEAEGKEKHQLILRIAAIQWFVDSWINNIHEGEEAQRKLKEFNGFEVKKQGVKPNG